MKRVFRILGLAAVVALVAVSCKKNEGTKSFNVNVSELKGFQAGPSLDGSKAYFDPNDGYQFKWSEGDNLVIYNLASNYEESATGIFGLTSGAGTHNATFEGGNIGDMKNVGYFLFYNGEKAHRDLQEDNRETFTVSAEQNYDPACKADPTAMVMACKVNQNQVAGTQVQNFTMQHIFGYLNVAIADNLDQNNPKKVTSIVVTDAKWNLSGDVSLKLGEVDAETLDGLINQCESTNGGEAYLNALSTYLNTLGYIGQGEGKSITMNCNNFQLPWRQWQYFFISLRPGALYKGFTVTINYNDGTSASHTFDANINYLIKPAYFRNVYFTTAQGFLQ